MNKRLYTFLVYKKCHKKQIAQVKQELCDSELLRDSDSELLIFQVREHFQQLGVHGTMK